MKKIIVILLVVAMALSLSSCSSSSEKTAAKTNDATTKEGKETTVKTTIGTQDTQQTTAKSTKEVEELKVHQLITLGKYEQDNDLENGKEGIEWYVLDIVEGKALVLSWYILDAIPYNETNANVTWETCGLRKWLNEDFFNTAFSPDEKAKIVSVTLKNPGNTYFNISGGSDTIDKVFVLSTDELKKYSDIMKLINSTMVTPYGIAQGIETGRIGLHDTYGGWWLRNPGREHNRASIVGHGGHVGEVGWEVHRKEKCGVRPALWIEVEGLEGRNPPPRMYY